MAVSTLSFRAYIAKLSGRKLGAFKRAAALAGITFAEYVDRVEQGLKRCTDCGRWKSREEFALDASRWDGLSAKCFVCTSARGIAGYDPIPVEAWAAHGPARVTLENGDADRARGLINREVDSGRRPDPNDLHCALCGHLGSDRRHEYHHHMGYSADHLFDVLPLCTICHHGEHRDSIERRSRNPNGTFSGSEGNG